MPSDLGIQHPTGVANLLALEKNRVQLVLVWMWPAAQATDGVLRGLSIETMEQGSGEVDHGASMRSRLD